MSDKPFKVLCNVTCSFSCLTGNKRVRGIDLKTPVCVFQYGQIRSPLAFSMSVRLAPLVTHLTPPPLFSGHRIWASLYLPNRGHLTAPGKAGPLDYFSSSSTVTVQQQQFVQFLKTCACILRTFSASNISERRRNRCEVCAIKCIYPQVLHCVMYIVHSLSSAFISSTIPMCLCDVY